jgi:hypothetical protein
MKENRESAPTAWLRPVFIFFVAFCFAFVGILQLIGVVIVGWQSFQANKWPTVPGTIIESTVRVDRVRGGSAYTPTVTYAYKFAGQLYEGHRITAMDSADAEPTVRAIVGAFPPGRIVDVHVDPKYPVYALLKPGIFSYLVVWAALAIFGITLGSVGMIWVVRNKNADVRSISRLFAHKV